MSTTPKYRFVPKSYGWGFVPVSWEGRLCTLFLLCVVGGAAYRNGLFAPSIEEPTFQQSIGFLVDLFLIIFASSRFMEKKTRGVLKWRWGRDKDTL